MVASEVNASFISRRQILVWGLFAVLATFIAVIEGGALFAEKVATKTGRERVFAFAETDLGAVEILYQGRRATLMRDSNGEWFKHGGSHAHSGNKIGNNDRAKATSNEPSVDTHISQPEEAEAIRAQLVVSARMLADRRISAKRALKEYGLETPSTMFAFYPRKGQQADFSRPLSVLYVGDLLTTDYAYYTLVDGDSQITLLPRYQVALLLAAAFGADAVPSITPPDSASK